MNLQTGNGALVWKMITTFLAGVVLTLTGVWFTYVKGSVTEPEMRDYVSHYSPFVLAESGIRQQQQDQDQRTMDLDRRLTIVEARQNQIRSDLDRAVARSH